MSVNGKRDGFVLDDLIALGRFGGLKRTRARAIVEEVDACAGQWRDLAEQAGLDTVTARKIEAAHRRLVSLAA